jgi:PAT family beta-lactamase induction signal transducer AmpG
VLAGPPAGYLADAIGWRDFFILTVFTGVPGLMMLARFVPWGTREPEFHVEAPSRGAPLSQWALAGRASLGGFLSWFAALLLMTGMAALGTLRSGTGLQWGDHLQALLAPQSLGGWLTALGILLTGLFGGLATGAILVARRGLERRPAAAG